MTMRKFGTFSTDVPLSPAPINPGWILEGSPSARNRVLERSTDGLACTIVWECSAGTFDWHYDIDETVYILSGGVTLSDDRTPPRRLGPGDVVFFPNGSRVRWHVEDHVRKIAFCQKTLPSALQYFVSALRRLKGMARGQAGSGSLMDTNAA